jgi:hypothetical protein
MIACGSSSGTRRWCGSGGTTRAWRSDDDALLLLLPPQPRRVLFNDVLIYKHTLLNQIFVQGDCLDGRCRLLLLFSISGCEFCMFMPFVRIYTREETTRSYI